MRALLALLVPVSTCAALAVASADPKPDPKPDAKSGVAALHWLEGSWRSAETDGVVWEACYSSPAGGEIVSATKRIQGGKVTLFDFERIREEGDKVVLTPFPHGKASVDFTLMGFDPSVERAVFANPEHDFPQRMRYERSKDGHLLILLAAEKDGKHVGFKLDLVRTTP